MSLEVEIAELRKAVVELTAVVSNNNIAAIGSASTEAVKGASEKPATKKKAAAKKEEPVEDDLDAELDGLTSDTPADDDLGLDDDAEEVTVSKDELKTAFSTLAKKSGGRESVIGILKKYKAGSFGDLKEADFAAAYADVQKALK